MIMMIIPASGWCWLEEKGAECEAVSLSPPELDASTHNHHDDDDHHNNHDDDHDVHDGGGADHIMVIMLSSDDFVHK